MISLKTAYLLLTVLVVIWLYRVLLPGIPDLQKEYSNIPSYLYSHFPTLVD